MERALFYVESSDFNGVSDFLRNKSSLPKLSVNIAPSSKKCYLQYKLVLSFASQNIQYTTTNQKNISVYLKLFFSLEESNTNIPWRLFLNLFAYSTHTQNVHTFPKSLFCVMFEVFCNLLRA